MGLDTSAISTQEVPRLSWPREYLGQVGFCQSPLGWLVHSSTVIRLVIDMINVTTSHPIIQSYFWYSRYVLSYEIMLLIDLIILFPNSFSINTTLAHSKGGTSTWSIQLLTIIDLSIGMTPRDLAPTTSYFISEIVLCLTSDVAAIVFASVAHYR